MRETRENNPFVLTLLGTDTQFTNKKKTEKKKARLKKGQQVTFYPKGETLSLISELIETTKEHQPNSDKNIAYQTDEVTVINGPDTLGKAVGNRIGLGLSAALKAIARGQKDIKIIAHSRGAVQGILVAHELEAMQKIIADPACTSLEQLFNQLKAQHQERLNDKTHKYTSVDFVDALESQLPKSPAERQSLFAALQTNIPALTVAYFGIDPVPGDVAPITWYDQRYFELPKSIKKAHLRLYENERSDWGFTPIYPISAAGANQEIEYQSLPGNHGTGSTGNNASQRAIVQTDEYLKATHVQKLLIFQLLEFLSSEGVHFKDAKALFSEHSGLGNKYAYKHNRANTPEKIDVTQINFPELYRELYSKITDNKGAYEAFNRTSYQLMGVLPYGRRVLLSGHKYGLLADVLPLNSGYVNTNHDQLMREYFFQLFGVKEPGVSPIEQLEIARKILIARIREAQPKLDGSFVQIPTDTAADLNKLAARNNVLMAFTAIIEKVSYQYLSNNWSNEELPSKKAALFSAIKIMIDDFNQLQEELANKEENKDLEDFVKTLMNTGLEQMTRTLQLQHKNLSEHFIYLTQSAEDKLKSFFNGLINQERKTDENNDGIIQEILEDQAYKQLENHPLDKKFDHIFSHLPEEIRANMEQKEYRDNFLLQTHESIDSFERTYHQMELFADDCAALEDMNEFSAAQKELLQKLNLIIRKNMDALIATMAQKFYKDRPNELPTPDMTNKPRMLAEQYAIEKLGVADQQQEQQKTLEATINQLQVLVNQQNDQRKILEESFSQLQEEKKRSDETNQKLRDAISINDSEYTDLIEKKLIPLSKNYLAYLNKKDKADTKVQGKINAVAGLLKILEDKNTPIASERVLKFYTALNTAKPTIELHRDNKWHRYTRNALVAAAIILSGIIPGLLALTVQSKMKLGTSTYSFWESTGSTFFSKAKKDTPPEIAEKINKPSK